MDMIVLQMPVILCLNNTVDYLTACSSIIEGRGGHLCSHFGELLMVCLFLGLVALIEDLVFLGVGCKDGCMRGLGAGVDT